MTLHNSGGLGKILKCLGQHKKIHETNILISYVNKQLTRRSSYNILSVALIRGQVLTFSELKEAYGRKSRKSFIDHHFRIMASYGLFVIVIGQRGSEVLVPDVHWPG